jgi:hypothetical protein
MDSAEIKSATGSLLSQIGYERQDFRLEQLSASGNNRVYVVYLYDKKIALKWYFNDPTDSRDRLGSEFAFLEHAWDIGIRCIPQPLAKDQTSHLALYEFIEGLKIDKSQVDENLVQQAAVFLKQLNSQQSRDKAGLIPKASEACFSVSEHLAVVDSRLARLEKMPIEGDLDRAATLFVKRLNDFWKTTKDQLLLKCNSFGLNTDSALLNDEMCLSPSDFGFHNALFRPDGNLCFVDFEYAGWDDPAKAIGDFFSHPGIAVSHKYFESFVAKVLEPYDSSEKMAARVRLLEPISQIKWCCIILNEFLPASAKRRNFANPGNDGLARKERQLHKATQFFETLQH